MIYAIMISNQCNFHCGHCMVNSTHKFNLVSSEVTDRFIEIIAQNHADSVYIIGGEPLIHADYVERLIQRIRPLCHDIVIFTNGSFLLDETLSDLVKGWNVRIRISNDRFHRKFWSQELERRIRESGYNVEERADDYEMIPVGRAYQEFKDLQYNMGCSLLSGFYDERYPNHHRCMVMQDGSVNLYCAAIGASLANVFDDQEFSYEALKQREITLHNYLVREVFTAFSDTFMGKLCNACPRYTVTETEILYDGAHVGWTKDYAGEYEDLYEKFKDE